MLTQDDIEIIIDTEAAAHPELLELQSNSSNVAFWPYARKVFSFVISYFSKMLDKHKTDVLALIDTTEVGSIDWYLAMMREYQHGDQLLIVENRPQYAELDPELQIVSRVAAKEVFDVNGYRIDFKVVKTQNNQFVPLLPAELTALYVYANRRKIPGTWITVQSLPADVLNLKCDVTLSALLYDSTGHLIEDGSEAVKKQIELFLKTFDFGGVLYLSQLVSSVKALPGVVDFYIDLSKINGVLFVKSTESNAGYITLDQQSIFNYVLL